jgi:hypothetical protein
LYGKVKNAEASGQETRSITSLVQGALELRLPSVVPADFSKYEELAVVLAYLGDQFSAAGPLLRTEGFICTTRRSEDQISARIEHRGETDYSLDVNRGGGMGDDKLTFGLGHHRGLSGGFNGRAEPYFDKQAGLPKLKLTDLSVLGGLGTGERVLSKEELFEALWVRIIDQLESR